MIFNTADPAYMVFCHFMSKWVNSYQLSTTSLAQTLRTVIFSNAQNLINEGGGPLNIEKRLF